MNRKLISKALNGIEETYLVECMTYRENAAKPRKGIRKWENMKTPRPGPIPDGCWP